jgi:hypothetical protein
MGIISMEDTHIKLSVTDEGGYYPYPPHRAEAAVSWFILPLVVTLGQLLYPCAGEGEITCILVSCSTVRPEDTICSTIAPNKLMPVWIAPIMAHETLPCA